MFKLKVSNAGIVVNDAVLQNKVLKEVKNKSEEQKWFTSRTISTCLFRVVRIGGFSRVVYPTTIDWLVGRYTGGQNKPCTVSVEFYTCFVL